MIEEAIVSILKAHAGLNALVNGRIYPVLLPQTPTLPAVTYQLISDGREYTHEGDAGLRTATFQFACWANDFRTARDVAGQVVNALSGYRGMVGTTEIQSCFQTNRTHIYESTTATHQQIVDFDISVREG